MNRYRDVYLNWVLAPEGELLSFAPPRQLLLHCSTSCIHAVEKKVAKEKAARSPLMSCAPRICRGTAKGASCPFAAARLPCRTLYALGCFGLFPTNTPVLDAANGRKARYCVTSLVIPILFHRFLEPRFSVALMLFTLLFSPSSAIGLVQIAKYFGYCRPVGTKIAIGY